MKVAALGLAASIAIFALMGCSPTGQAGPSARTPNQAGPTTEALSAQQVSSTTTITNATLSSEPPRPIIPYINWEHLDVVDDEEPSLQTWGAPEPPYTGPVGKYGF